VSQSEYLQDRTALLTVYNNLPHAVCLQGCNPYILERKEGGAWVERHAKRCFWEGEAVRVPSLGKREIEIPLRSEEGFGGTYRVKIAYWYQCRSDSAGLPVSAMNCERQGQVYSSEFTVRAP
jgi:hypothetical protein